MAQNCKLKNGLNGKFCVCVYHNKKNKKITILHSILKKCP